ncbi:MAG: sulfite exporter TauE/SafE family protein [bacterium]|nr:sulfite exporter TauE/SafE family protein [bacterium]
MEVVLYLVPIFFIIAFIYSSVGFGGGSSYVAILALFLFPYQLIPRISLICNIIVVLAGCFIFIKSKHLRIKKVLPFVLGSVPLSYLGGQFAINRELFLSLLALSLIIASSNMLFWDKYKKNGEEKENPRNSVPRTKIPFLFEVIVGSAIGLLSGFVGIGGGIFLAPVLHLRKWGNPKQIAGTSCFFILINSIAGLFGQFSKGGSEGDLHVLIPLAVAVFLGGQLGSRLGAGILPELVVKKATAVLVMFVGVKILFELTI